MLFSFLIYCIVIGGCYVEGNVIKNAFRWKQTIGPWENRPGHYGDVWGYWTDDGFGYFEGLQVCTPIFFETFTSNFSIKSCLIRVLFYNHKREFKFSYKILPSVLYTKNISFFRFSVELMYLDYIIV
jgi:hypothetical protein